MKAIELKKRLIDRINLSDNIDLLEEFYRFLNLENEVSETYILSEEQHAAITKARTQIKKGDCLTDKKPTKRLTNG